MAVSRVILGIDAAAAGASARGLDLRPPPNGIKERELISPFGFLTTVRGRTSGGLPFRVDIGVPSPVHRTEQGQLLGRQELEPDLSPGDWRQHLSSHARVVQHLSRQASPEKRAAGRIGVVVPDGLDPETAEEYLRALRLGGTAVLLPRPIAAAWAWLQGRSKAPPIPSDGKRNRVGELMSLHLFEGVFQLVRLHLIWHPEIDWHPFVPARDRENDKLVEGSWTPSESGMARVRAALQSEFAKGESLPVGMVVTGRPGSPEKTLAAIDSLISQLPLAPEQILVDGTQGNDGLLSTGALLAARMVAEGRVPYYETLPRIEIIASKESWNPNFLSAKEPILFWIDGLSGLSEVNAKLGFEHFLPANKLLKHTPEFPYVLTINTAQQVRFSIAFAGKHVRTVNVTVPRKGKDTEKVRLGVEYRLGSGRPEIKLSCVDRPNEQFVFRWDSADSTAKSRDQVSKFTLADFEKEDARRTELRRRKGFPV